MKLISTYIETSDFNKSINFYNKVLQTKPNIYCENRWVEYNIGNVIALYNKEYDEIKIKENIKINNNYNKAYIENFNKKSENKKNNIVTFNFHTKNLKEEYERIKELKIGEVSEIMYVNIIEPYYYFTILDPDGNVLEIYSEKYEQN